MSKERRKTPKLKGEKQTIRETEDDKLTNCWAEKNGDNMNEWDKNEKWGDDSYGDFHVMVQWLMKKL